MVESISKNPRGALEIQQQDIWMDEGEKQKSSNLIYAKFHLMKPFQCIVYIKLHDKSDL